VPDAVQRVTLRRRAGTTSCALLSFATPASAQFARERPRDPDPAWRKSALALVQAGHVAGGEDESLASALTSTSCSPRLFGQIQAGEVDHVVIYPAFAVATEFDRRIVLWRIDAGGRAGCFPGLPAVC